MGFLRARCTFFNLGLRLAWPGPALSASIFRAPESNLKVVSVILLRIQPWDSSSSLYNQVFMSPFQHLQMKSQELWQGNYGFCGGQVRSL